MNETRQSLVDQLRNDSPTAWVELDRLYRPLILGWLRKYGLQKSDVEDVTQDVLSIIFKEIKEFDHNGRTGAFRAWLRLTTVNVTRNFLRKRKAIGAGTSAVHDMLNQLEDSTTRLTGQFELEHDRVVAQRLLEIVEHQFEPTTMAIFRRHVLENEPAQKAADQLKVPVANVYKAKSRVLRRLRALATEILDEKYFAN